MKPFIRFGAFALVLASAGSTTAGYPNVAPGTPSAELIFMKGYKGGLTVAGVQSYLLSVGECSEFKEAASFLLLSGKRRSVKVAGGRYVEVMATTEFTYTQSVNMINGSPSANLGNASCDSSASFIAEVGHAYEVSQDSHLGGACHIAVVDKATGAAPETLKDPPVGTCGTHPNH